MNTPTHMLINWTVAKTLPVKSFPKSAVLFGSVAPDVPLYFLSLGGAVWFTQVKNMRPGDAARHMFGNLFYNHPSWISLHNVLHSPTVLVAAILLLFAIYRSVNIMRSWWTWFFGSCLLHTLIDIPVHHDDGPLIFWPLNWSYRISSPVSYWDPQHYGYVMMTLEAVLAISLAACLIWRRIGKSQSSETDMSEN